MHWYVLMKYAKELKELMKSGSKDAAREMSPIGRRWLKEVSVERLMVDDGAAKASQNVHRESGQERQSDVCLSSNNQVQKTTRNPIATAKPHLTSHERGGLLLLVHKMKNKLFHLEYPSSLSSPDNLITDIEELLQCALPPEVCSMEPSGVGVLMKRSTADNDLHRQRARKRQADIPVAPSCRKVGRGQELSSDHEQESTDITSSKNTISSDLTTKSMVPNSSLPHQSDNQRTISSMQQCCSIEGDSAPQLACKEHTPQQSAIEEGCDDEVQLVCEERSVSSPQTGACKGDEGQSANEQHTTSLESSSNESGKLQPALSSTKQIPHQPSDQGHAAPAPPLSSPLLILLSPGLPPTLISAASLPSLTLSSTSDSPSHFFMPKAAKPSLTQPSTLGDQKSTCGASNLSSSHSASKQIMSATSPVSLTQGFEEVTITQVLNPAFTE